MSLGRTIRFTLGLAAIGGGSLFFSGIALADSSAASDSAVVATSDTVTGPAPTATTVSETSSTSLVSPASDNPVTSTDSSQPSQTVTTIPQATAPVTEIHALPVAASVPSVQIVSDTPKVSVAPIVPKRALPVTFSYVPVADSESVSFSTATTPPVNPVASQPEPAKTPSTPLGAAGEFLNIFSQGVMMRASDQGNGFYIIAIMFVLFVLIPVSLASVLRRYVLSYGAWLKLQGYSVIASSGLPQPFSTFATPQLLGYVSAPAPYA